MHSWGQAKHWIVDGIFVENAQSGYDKWACFACGYTLSQKFQTLQEASLFFAKHIGLVTRKVAMVDLVSQLDSI